MKKDENIENHRKGERYLSNAINKMFQKYIRGFYILPISQVLGITAVLIAIWVILRMLVKGKYTIWKYFNIILHILSVLFIIRMTLLGRGIGERELELMPFYTLTTISYNNEAIRTLLMNIILFVPFGLTAPYMIDEKIRNEHLKWGICILSSCMLSVLIESLQYCFGLGRTEIDDVICNTLGGGLGVLADIVGFWLNDRRQKQRI